MKKIQTVCNQMTNHFALLRFGVVCTLSAILLAIGAPVLAQAPANNVRAVDNIIAIVNDEVITRVDLRERVRTVTLRAEKQNLALPAGKELEKQLLEQLINERVQLQLAKELGIKIDDVQLDRAMERIAAQNKMNIVDLRAHVEKDGSTWASFSEDIRTEIILQRLREREVDSKVQVAEADIDHALGVDQADNKLQEEINLAHILIRIPEGATPAQVAQLEGRARSVLQQAKSGGDFSLLASNFSDSSEAPLGGDLGWRAKDRLPQLFLDAIADLNAGQISDIVRSANGFHILKFIAKRSVEKKLANLPSVQQTRVRHILIKVNEAVAATDAKRKLLDIKQRLQNKVSSFEELAKLFSNDGSANIGGDLGWVYPGDLVPEFERTMDALQPGQVSDPIETQFGYHLIEVIERKTAAVSSERQRMAVRQDIRERKAYEQAQEWLRGIRDRAYVEYRLEE